MQMYKDDILKILFSLLFFFQWDVAEAQIYFNCYLLKSNNLSEVYIDTTNFRLIHFIASEPSEADSSQIIKYRKDFDPNKGNTFINYIYYNELLRFNVSVSYYDFKKNFNKEEIDSLKEDNKIYNKYTELETRFMNINEKNDFRLNKNFKRLSSTLLLDYMRDSSIGIPGSSENFFIKFLIDDTLGHKKLQIIYRDSLTSKEQTDSQLEVSFITIKQKGLIQTFTIPESDKYFSDAIVMKLDNSLIGIIKLEHEYKTETQYEYYFLYPVRKEKIDRELIELN